MNFFRWFSSERATGVRGKKQAVQRKYPRGGTVVLPAVISPLNKLHAEYAELYASFRQLSEREAYIAEGLKDFLYLIQIPGVEHVGIDRLRSRLVVGTKAVHLLDEEKCLRELGPYTIVIDPRNKRYCIEAVKPAPTEFPHPHVNSSGTFCMSTGHMELMTAITDACFSQATRMLVAALFMNSQNVDSGSKFAKIEKWPKAKEVRS